MNKTQISPMPEYFDRYIKLVREVEILQAFDESINQLNKLDNNLLNDLDGKTPEPGKWTAKEIIQHIIDWERILSYRVLLYARKEGSIPQGIDEKRFAENTKANGRTIESLITELKAVRVSTKAMFESFDNETLLTTGINWKYEVSVLAMGFTIIGHQIHHLKIIEEKYYPLLAHGMAAN